MAAPVLQFKRGLLTNLPGLRAGEPGFTTDSYDLYVGIDSTSNNNKFFGSHRYWKKETTSTGSGVNFVEGTSAGTDYVTLKAPNTLAGIVTFTLPATDGSNGNVLVTDGSGNLSFSAAAASSFNLAGDTGTDTFNTGETLTFAGTADQIKTTVTNNQVQIGLTTNVIVGGALTVSGNTTLGDSGSDLITVVGVTTFTTSNVYVNNQLYVGGLQVTGSQTVLGDDITTRHLNVTGVSTFVGAVTFQGGTINLGDANTDDINVAGEFVSSLIPNTNDTYDLGDAGQNKRWRNASFSGVGTFASGVVGGLVTVGVSSNNTIGTLSGNLIIDSAGSTTTINDFVDIQNSLNVSGNVTIGGTILALTSDNVWFKNKDIVLGYTTSVSNTDASTDDTANHGGVAIASTIGTPLVDFSVSGVNTLPSTYKQMMWFKSGTLGFGTDAFAFNYGVAIGTTNMANGLRLAVGSGITMTDTEISATTFRGSLVGNSSSADQVKTVTASDLNATHYLTFVNSHNGSATNEAVYTDDGIYYNPGTNTFTTQNGNFTGNVTVDGTLTGTISTATRATTVDTTSTSTNTNYHLVFTDNATSTTGATMRVDAGIYYNPSSNYLFATQFVGDLVAGTIKAADSTTAMTLANATGNVTFNGDIQLGGNDIKASDGNTNITLTSNTLTTFAGDIKISGNDIQASDGTVAITISNSNGNVKSGGDLVAGSGFLASANATRGLYIYDTSGDVSFQGKAIVDNIRSSSNANNTITINDLDATFARNVVVTGIATVGTALSTPTLKTTTIQHTNGTQAATIDTSGNITASQNLTVSGNLYVNGSTTQVNTSSITVEDRTIELGLVDGSAPGSATTWDLGVLFNYNSSGAKKSAVIWEHQDGRFKFGSQVTDGGGTDNDSPQITVSTYAPIEVSELWVNNTCTGGSSQVIACSGANLILQNITIDGGSF